MWESAAEFLAMGGYARFIWPVWLIAGVGMPALYVMVRQRARAAEARLAALTRKEDGDQ